jgi:hypothetical protein
MSVFAKWIESDSRFLFQDFDNGGVEVSIEEHAALIDGNSKGKHIVPDENGLPVLSEPLQPTQEQVIKQYEAELDAHMDGVAKQYRYNDRFTFALRAAFDGPFHAEGVAFAQWMDACNVQAFALLKDVIDGKAALPTIEAFIASLPVFVKP